MVIYFLRMSQVELYNRAVHSIALMLLHSMSHTFFSMGIGGIPHAHQLGLTELFPSFLLSALDFFPFLRFWLMFLMILVQRYFISFLKDFGFDDSPFFDF